MGYPHNVADSSTVEGDSIKKWASQLSASFNVTASYYAFSGAAAASFKEEGAEEVRTYRRDYTNKFVTYQVTSNDLEPYKKLTEATKHFLMTADIENISNTI